MIKIDTQNIQQNIIIIGVMTIMWTALYALVHVAYRPKSLSKKKILDTKNRIVSMIHGVLSFLLAVRVFMTEEFKYMFLYLVNLTQNTKPLLSCCLFHIVFMILWLVSTLDSLMQDLLSITHSVFLGLALPSWKVTEPLMVLAD